MYAYINTHIYIYLLICTHSLSVISKGYLEIDQLLLYAFNFLFHIQRERKYKANTVLVLLY